MKSPKWFSTVCSFAAAALLATGTVFHVGCDNDPVANNSTQSSAANSSAPQPAPGTPVLYVPGGEKSSSSIALQRIEPKDPVTVGSQYTYTIRVTNLTDQPLTGVTVYESLAGGMQYDYSLPPGTI